MGDVVLATIGTVSETKEEDDNSTLATLTSWFGMESEGRAFTDAAAFGDGGIILGDGISGGVHMTTIGMAAFSSGIVVCAISGCTRVVGAETR
jgi:hypothetical protein